MSPNPTFISPTAVEFKKSMRNGKGNEEAEVFEEMKRATVLSFLVKFFALSDKVSQPLIYTTALYTRIRRILLGRRDAQ